MFCPKCGGMVFPKGGKISCRQCGTVTEATKIEAPGKAVEKSIEREQTVITEKLETLPKTKQHCKKCDNNEAYWVLRQTRAADEPATRIYQCTKCGYKWREY